MELKKSKIFNKEIMQAVSAFCESEGIKDIDHFMYLCFKQGFDIKRYGLLEKTLNDGEKDLKIGGEQEKWVEKEVIVEKRVEIPVEVIKEVEKIVEVIKEVPVEKVVEKEIYITDDSHVKELGEKITKLEEERQNFSTKIEEYETERQIFSTKMEQTENNFQNEMSKKDNELDELRQTLYELRQNDKLKLLQETLQTLRGELQQKNQQINELEKINRELNSGNSKVNAILLRGSNLNNRI